MNENDKPKVEFTDVHRLLATRAALAKNVLVLDLGPKPPPGPVELATPEEIEAAKAAKRAHDEWHDKNKEPVAVEMHKVDAVHAVQADPERYVIVPAGPRAPLTLEERVAYIERRLGPETQDEIDARAKRDADLAERNKVAASEPPAPDKPLPYTAGQPYDDDDRISE